MFPNISAGLVDVLEQMLEFNPYLRGTAKELIKHNVFDDIRRNKEIECPYKVKFDNEQQSYDDCRMTKEEKLEGIM